MDIKTTTKHEPKIIALLPFKNEELFLKEYIYTIQKITNHIIAHDNGSTDNSAQMLKDAGATVIPRASTLTKSFQEFEIRTLLLEHGRKAGGTHFICLDADEVFTDAFFPRAKELILALSPGQSLWMDWVTLYGDAHEERTDGVYKKINKNFIFCDDEGLTFSYVFLGVSRTPGDVLNRVVIERNTGAVIHYQYLNTKRSNMKRIWYMCYEHTQKRRTPVRINTTYEIQKDTLIVPTKKLTSVASYTIINQSITSYEQETDWRFTEILSWFDTYGIEYFEPLDIWDIDVFKKLFEKKIYRTPHPTVLPTWLRMINDLKNKIKIHISLIKK